MPVTITSQLFYDEFTSVSGGGYQSLLDCVGGKVTAITDFYVKWSAEDVVIITDASGTITRMDDGSFISDGFRVSDTFTLTGAGLNNGNYTITELTDTVITVASLPTGDTYGSAYIYGTTPVVSVDYFWSLIENDSPNNLFHPVDTETKPMYYANDLNPTGSSSHDMVVGSNSKGWEISDAGFGAVILELGTEAYKQKFRITQVFLVPNPVYSQLKNLQDGIPPAPQFYQDRLSLKHVCKIDARYDNVDPEPPHSLTYSRKGATAWYDEFMNGKAPAYSLTSIAYSVAGETVTELQYEDDTDVTIVLSSTNSTFGTGTSCVITQTYIPGTSSEVVNTSTYYDENFALDRILQTAGLPAKNGISYGTNWQQITNLTVTYVNASTLRINYTSSLASDLQTRLDAKSIDNRWYVIAVAVQNPSVATTKGTDRVAVLCDVDQYDQDKDDSTLFNITPAVSFTGLGGFADYGNVVRGFAGDNVLATVPFRVKNSVDAKITELGITIEAYYAADTTRNFDLETWTVDLSSYELVKGTQQLAISQARGYRLPSDDENNLIVVARDSSLDSDSYAGYVLTYPFTLRYETWRYINDADSDFGNQATHDWSLITAESGWQIKFNVTADVLATNDHTTEFTQSCDIYVSDQNATGDTGVTCIISTANEDGDDLEGDILADADTVITADFYGDFSTLPTGATDYACIIYLDQNPIGGETWRWVFHSDYDTRTDDGKSPFVPVAGAIYVEVTPFGTTRIRARAVLDYTKLEAPIESYIISARLIYLY